MKFFFAAAILTFAGVVVGSFWMEEIGHHGRSPFHPDPSYQIFRNVRDFGAKGDGVTDDTAAINAAISAGARCEPGSCKGGTVSPATVYFPSGTYLITNSIIDAYYTQLVGDPTNRPAIVASPSFAPKAFGLIDSNVYQADGELAWNSTDVFFRQIRNFVVDTTAMPSQLRAVGIHWPSSQATSISNVEFRLSTSPGNNHTGLFIEEGSGGLLSDLYFYGGGKAAILGNQQYTARNMWFEGAEVAINMPWDWGWTYRNIYFKDCQTGIQMDNDAKSVGSVTLIDSVFTNVGIAVNSTRTGAMASSSNGTLIMENVKFDGVTIPVVAPGGVVLSSQNLSEETDDVFTMGHVLNDTTLLAVTGYYKTAQRSPGLLDNNGDYYSRSKPQYENIPSANFISARTYGAQGDGSTDDTAHLNGLLTYAAERDLVVFLDAGVYMITDTVYIPPNSRIVGEALATVLMATGAKFEDVSNPHPVVQAGKPGDSGSLEWSDTIVSTRGGCAGAVLIEYNMYTSGTPSGLWDVHTRVGGAAGTNLQLGQCPAIVGQDSANPACMAAYMSMHITPSAGGLYSENCWLWVADHDLEDQMATRISIYSGRGLLVESVRGRIWLSATGSEHHVLYQYQLANTRDVFLGQTQTESPYFQPHPPASLPFPRNAALNDPNFVADCASYPEGASCQSAWGMRIINSERILSYGTGLYSFFDTYNDTCAVGEGSHYCQARILAVLGQADGVKFAGFNTVGTKVMVQRNGHDLVPGSVNNSTFADSLALYEL